MTHHYYLDDIRLHLELNPHKGIYTVQHKHYDIKDAHDLPWKNVADHNLKTLQYVAEKSGWPGSYSVNGLILNAIYAQHKHCSIQTLKRFFKNLVAVYPNTYEYNQYYLVYREHYAEHTMLLYKNKGFTHFYHDSYLDAQAYLHYLFSYKSSLFPKTCDKTDLWNIAKKHLKEYNNGQLTPTTTPFLHYDKITIQRDGIGNFYYSDTHYNNLFLGYTLAPEHYPFESSCPAHIQHGLTYHMMNFVHRQEEPSWHQWYHFINTLHTSHGVHPTIKCDMNDERQYGLRMVYKNIQIHIRQHVGIHYISVNKELFKEEEVKEIASALRFAEQMVQQYPEWLEALYFKQPPLSNRMLGAILMRLYTMGVEERGRLYNEFIWLKPDNVWDFFKRRRGLIDQQETTLWL